MRTSLFNPAKLNSSIQSTLYLGYIGWIGAKKTRIFKMCLFSEFHSSYEMYFRMNVPAYIILRFSNLEYFKGIICKCAYMNFIINECSETLKAVALYAICISPITKKVYTYWSKVLLRSWHTSGGFSLDDIKLYSKSPTHECSSFPFMVE